MMWHIESKGVPGWSSRVRRGFLGLTLGLDMAREGEDECTQVGDTQAGTVG